MVLLKRLSSSVIFLTICLTILPVGIVKAQTFKNCATLRVKFPNGVAVNFGVIGTSGAEINRAIYLRNQRLDRDKDGVVCEDELKQNPTTTTTTTTLVGMRSGNLAPSGTWEDLNFYDRRALLFGRSYRIHTCATGDRTTYFEVQTGGTWVQKAKSVTSRPSSFCDETYPYLHSYYWIADAPETGSTSSLNTRLTGFSAPAEVTREVLRTSSQVTPTTTGNPGGSSSNQPTTTTIRATTTTFPTLVETTIFGRPFLSSSGNWILPNIELAPGFTAIQAYVNGSWVKVNYLVVNESFGGASAHVANTFGFNVLFRHIQELYNSSRGQYEIVRIWNRSPSSGY